MSGHTPGPWEVSDASKKRTSVVVPPHSYIADCASFSQDLGECQANARLIAAAPEMLELLRKVSESNVSPHRNDARALLERIDGESDK